MKEKEMTGKGERNFSSLVSALGNLYNRISRTKDQEANESEELAQCVIKAHEEWQNAENFFHSVSDPDLIDHAIYRLEASKARYTYLIKQAKAEGIKVDLH